MWGAVLGSITCGPRVLAHHYIYRAKIITLWIKEINRISLLVTSKINCGSMNAWGDSQRWASHVLGHSVTWRFAWLWWLTYLLNKLVMLLGQPSWDPMFRQRTCPAGCVSLLCQLVRVPKLLTVAPDICGASEWALLFVTLLVPGIFRWLVDVWNVCVALLSSVTYRHVSAVFLYEIMWNLCLHIAKTAILKLFGCTEGPWGLKTWSKNNYAVWI